MVDKSEDSFTRVFDTKVNPTRELEAAIKDDTRFIVLFASVSGIFGNQGQVDYAGANDALATYARHLDKKLSARVVAIDWGPWGGGGMVSKQLEREFMRRGIGLLDPGDAVNRLFAELGNTYRDPEVVIMRGTPEAFGDPTSKMSSTSDG